MTVRDEVQPGDRWEFDDAVTDAFDDMLARSIPDYQQMRRTVTDLAVRLLRPGDRVLDLGCSRGEALAQVLDDPRLPSGVSGVGVEVSQPMAAAARDRFADERRVEIVEADVVDDGLPPGPYGVALAVLTVQFTPIEHRLALLAAIADELRPGGALLLVEKVIGASAPIDALLTDAYRDHKRAQGYTEEQIVRKAAALRGVLVPVPAAWNEDVLRRCGFPDVDVVWRWGPFAAWLALRPG